MTRLCRYGKTKGGKGDQSCSVPKGDASLIVISVSLIVALDKSFIKISKSENQRPEDKRRRSRKGQGGGLGPQVPPLHSMSQERKTLEIVREE